MRKIILLVVMTIFFGTNPLWALNDFNMPVEITSGYLHWVKVSKYKNDVYLTGTANKPLGKDLHRARVRVTFLDNDGKQVAEKYTDLSVLRTHLHRGDKGRFTLRTPYLSPMQSCQVALVWGKK